MTSLAPAITFVGHLSVDRNAGGGKAHILDGGGVVHSSVTAQRLGARARVLTMGAPADRFGFSILSEFPVELAPAAATPAAPP